ncbi:MAG: HAD family phosphatase [Candidatus Aminicenantes bacterium]
MIRTIISDMGNVLLFFDHMIFIRRIAVFTSHSPQEILRILQKHIELIKDFSRGKMEPEAYVDKMIQLLGADIRRKDFISTYRNIFSVNRNALEVLKEMKDFRQMVLLSNTDFIHFEYIKEVFPDMLIFDEYVLSFQEGLIKPEIEIYKKALEKAGIAAEEAVFIDDLEDNVKPAVDLGMKGIVYRKDMDLRAELRRYGIGGSTKPG